MYAVFRTAANNLRRNFQFCKFSLSRKMDMETDDDCLYYSHQKFKQLILQKGNKSKDEVFTEYLKGLKYPSVQDFTPGLEWFNVSEPLSFKKHLKGKIVVLDFFTYCCINCMHIIPELREIENEFSVEDGLVVIGVHSAKFENEKVSSNILAAVQRYNIGHPVVNDYNSDMWRNCEVNCWPTLLILGPHANPIVMLMGEGHKENLRLYISNALKYYKGKQEISNHKIPFESAFHLLPDLKGPLLFPGKITSTVGESKEDILAISDTGNNRILVMKNDGTILHEVGGKKAGFKDGSLDDAQFNAPQGLVFSSKDVLFVADTENHAIRKIDLKNGVVETVAGTGVQGNDRVGGNLGKQQEISSPWDLAIYRTPDMDMTFYPDGNPPQREVLIIAMAGTHQIWALFLDDTIWWKGKKYPAGTCVCIAGSGREENKNNAYPHNAAFAQPSGLALSMKNKEVFIADSESSSVRRMSLVDGKVTAVVGGDRNPNNLFAFGDKDGILQDAKLQHLLGLALSKDGDTLFVADTYNHKLKKVDLKKNCIVTLSGMDATDGKQNSFNEPAGLCLSGDGKKLYLADTNNHLIKIVELDSTSIKRVRNINLHLPKQHQKADRAKLQVVNAKPVKVNSKGGKIILKIDMKLVKGLKITEDGVQSWVIEVPDATWSCVPSSGSRIDDIDVVISVPPCKNIKDSLSVDFVFKLITCTDETCIPKHFVLSLPIGFSNDGATSLMRVQALTIEPSAVKVN